MSLPYVTADLPGVAALLKAAPEDFRVDEIPAYLPSGEGEHLFLLVEKTGRDTRGVADALARALGANPRDVGVAGQKDRQAVATQWMSVAGVARERAAGLEGDGFRVLEAKRHGNKLRTGHLRGNAFRIVLRGVDAEGEARTRAIAAALERRGLPNYYGAQRFGRRGDNAEVGRLVLLGREDDPRVKRARRDPRLRRFLVSAFQSEVFNEVLARRLRDGTWDAPLAGDVLQKLGSGGLFVCADPAADAPRVSSFECSVTGPMVGARTRPAPSGDPAALEADVLATTGVGPEHLSRSRDALGARRPLRLPLRISLERRADALALSFELPPGAYATSVIREITKPGGQSSDRAEGRERR
ncbi:MAG TPA: tRNA pseudouridine(13) synthase TruD [Vulgatibacter sp.]|nr:tRNA pseudouridine(13) synthase TruD [Vulgatibacter sp.]